MTITLHGVDNLLCF